MLRILVVEDDAVSAKIMMHILKAHATCDLATNGKRALELFTGAYEAGSPYDAVFLDIMLPMISGQGVLSSMRDYEAGRRIEALKWTKVIMTTALSDEQNLLDSHIMGCSAYLVKPIEPHKIIEVLRSINLIK